MGKIVIGDTVSWKWLSGSAEGKVLDIIPERTEVISKGRLIVRNGTKDNPAVIIVHKNGNEVLKLLSEIKKYGH